MNKTQEELKQKTLEAIAPDIGEMLEHYDEVLELEDTLNTRIDRIEAMWGHVKARTDFHIAKLMNELAGGVVEKQLIKKKEQIEAAEAGEVRIHNGGNWHSRIAVQDDKADDGRDGILGTKSKFVQDGLRGDERTAGTPNQR
jgi:hypothetical protein